ncbi:hypothetical protein LSH36_839g02005 [Paralvinella palmiformis]|uniref:THAP-type domain-containing protein n=1 Tax=Paralvinella palmiformis TaxID=53620 RepID=A0AAD9IYS3_9ANNE|nr:hypothetical protein LSH36_839g02005 [Paralvinella palmiformis]
MVTTKHCCSGVCRSDSHYADRKHMKGLTFMPFPKPHIDRAKSKRSTEDCKRRKHFAIDNFAKHIYICSLHFIGENGPLTSIQIQWTPQLQRLVLGLGRTRLILSLTMLLWLCEAHGLGL